MDDKLRPNSLILIPDVNNTKTSLYISLKALHLHSKYFKNVQSKVNIQLATEEG